MILIIWLKTIIPIKVNTCPLILLWQGEKIELFIDILFPVRYIKFMNYELESTPTFIKWLNKHKDRSTHNRLLARLSRLETGNFGDFKSIDTNLYELRFFFGSGIRIYYTIKKGRVILLLAAGDKSIQTQDIAKAKELLLEMEA